MGVLGDTASNLCLEEAARRLWESLDGSMDAFTLATGEPRPWPSTPWGTLSVAARVDFIASFASLVPLMAQAVMITHEVNGTPYEGS
jgi:hypothetical protein